MLNAATERLGVWIPRGGSASARAFEHTSGRLTEALERFREVDAKGGSIHVADGPHHEPTIAGAQRQPSSADVGQARYQPSDRERTMQARRLLKPSRSARIKDGNVNGVYRLRSTDGAENIYKPISREKVGYRRKQIPSKRGEYAKREVAAFRVDEALGFGLIPPTAMVKGPKGRGSVQQFVEVKGSIPLRNYPELQRKQLAVLDYIIGNTDRHPKNFRPDLNGNLVAIDHGLSFPETPYHIIDKFRNYEFVEKYEGQHIPEVLSAVRAVDRDRLRAALNDLELSRPAIDGVVDRLNKVEQYGGIPPIPHVPAR